MSQVPGVTASHQIITPGCRIIQGGDREALEEAVRRILPIYLDIVDSRTDTFDLHLVLSLERKP